MNPAPSSKPHFGASEPLPASRPRGIGFDALAGLCAAPRGIRPRPGTLDGLPSLDARLWNGLRAPPRAPGGPFSLALVHAHPGRPPQAPESPGRGSGRFAKLATVANFARRNTSSFRSA
jgi:hypothetical protein